MARFSSACAALALLSVPAQASQLLGSTQLPPGAAVGEVVRPLQNVTGVPGSLGPALPSADGALALGEAATPARLLQLRMRTAQELIRRNPRRIEADPQGNPVVRGEIVALQPSPEALQAALRSGFRVVRRSTLGDLGLEAVVLAPPPGASTTDAIQRLRSIDPSGAYDFNHLFQASGQVGGARTGEPAPAPTRGAPDTSMRLGLVDGSAAPVRGVRLMQKAFGPGGARVTDHATAVASLMVGAPGRRYGVQPAGLLYVADVFGPTPTGGSAEAIASGLGWLAQNQVRVVNISLVGPSNQLLAAAVAALARRGVVVVAAVGNDGPSAPPLYPAAYPGVVGVTAVDPRGRVLVEAGRGPQVDFAAPGADLTAETANGAVRVRGTSFAAPIVAGLLAGRSGNVDALAATAVDLGAPGKDPVYGRGLVGASGLPGK